MERLEVSNKIIGLISDVLVVQKDKIREELDLVKDLGSDSLDLVEIQMTAEDTFDIFLEDSELETMHTVKDYIDLVERKVNKS